MGEVRIPTPTAQGETVLWSPYMAQKFEAVVRDWICRVENGGLVFWSESHDPISTEHLRIAKVFLKAFPSIPVV